jgi:hypothetical protein
MKRVFVQILLFGVMAGATWALLHLVSPFVTLNNVSGVLLICASVAGQFWLFNYVENENSEAGYQRGRLAGWAEAQEQMLGREEDKHLPPREAEPSIGDR